MSLEVTFLTNLGMIAFAAFVFSIIFARFRLPMVVGQLLAGMLIGPFGLGLVKETNIIELLASLGVVLLMFVIGLELNPQEFRRIGFKLMLATSIEMGVSFASGLLVGTFIGLNWINSLFLASILSISSTAIVGKILLERWRFDEKESTILIGMLVLEDIVAVFLLVLLPSLTVSGAFPMSEALFFVLKGVALLASISAFGYFVAPRLLNFVSQYEIDIGEASFLLALGLGFLFAVVAANLGYSPAIGAFLAGLMVVGKPSKFVLRKLAPIRDLFIIIFFVSTGMLIDVRTALPFVIPIVVIVSVALASKFVGGWLAAKAIGRKYWSTTLGITLLPRGEFSFVISSLGINLGVLNPMIYIVAGVVTLITAIVGPVFLRLSKPKTM